MGGMQASLLLARAKQSPALTMCAGGVGIVTLSKLGMYNLLRLVRLWRLPPVEN